MQPTLVSGNADRLVDISEVMPMSDTDQPLFSELTEVLRKHGALQRFGITLLHQHFDVAADEVLLETTDKVTRTQTIRPVSKTKLEKLDYVVTSWRLDGPKPLMACACVNDPQIGHNHLPTGG